MNRLALIAACAVATSTVAQVRVEVTIPMPTITFQAPPPLVVVSPGVQVVEDYDDEVFFVDNHYWCRRDGRWFRSPDHRGGWVVVEGSAVPATIVRIPHGQYRRWKHGRGATVIVNPPGPGKVIVKEKHKGKEKHGGGDKHH